MIKFTKLFSILFITILFFTIALFSCSNESLNNPVINNDELTSIVEVVSLGSNTTATRTYTINNSLNIQINTENGTNLIQTFTDGKMTMIQYFNNGGALTGTQTYTYDSNDRIVSDSMISLTANQTINRTYEYVGNQILATRTELENDGTVTDEGSSIFTLNNNNQIIKSESVDYNFSWEATYINGNLSTFTDYVGNTNQGSALFSYTTELASIPYQKERYRFGAEWRNNIMLTETTNYSFKQLAELGTNYLASYTYTLAADPSMMITLSANYEFDDLGRLTKHTKNKIFFQTPINRVFTYQYE